MGSQYGDSQIIRLSSTRIPNGTFVEIVESFDSAGPIVDFSIVDVENIGQVGRCPSQ